jgi:hypothetical protein
MKTILMKLFFILSFFMVFANSNAQKMKMEKPKIIALIQTKGEFDKKELKLKQGDYLFEIENKEVGKDVGFYLHKANDKAQLKNSDKAGLIPNNQKRTTGVVSLTKGQYIYSCPLNPTKDYVIIVE